MKKLMCGMVVAALGLAGCGGAGSEYVGQWVMANNECSTMEISKNGDTFLVKIDPNGYANEDGFSMPGSLVEGVLKVKANLLVVDKSSGNLVVAKNVYKRLSGDKKVCKKEEPKPVSIEELRQKYSPSLVEHKGK